MSEISMTSQTVNPDLIKACAEMAFPGKGWFIRRVYYSSASDFKDRIEYVADAKEGEFQQFDPIGEMRHAWALERALKEDKNGGWQFGKYEVTGRYCAEGELTMLSDPSDTLLLLKCVSQQTGIEVYV